MELLNEGRAPGTGLDFLRGMLEDILRDISGIVVCFTINDQDGDSPFGVLVR